jgi:hypothetical protein
MLKGCCFANFYRLLKVVYNYYKLDFSTIENDKNIICEQDGV